MSSYVWMKVLESTPQRYDLGIRMLGGGRIHEVYEAVAARACADVKRPRVLDIGCGTGNVTLACAARGAEVTGIDLNAGMLEVAHNKAASLSLETTVEFLELSAVELEDRFAPQTFDAIVSCLAFSELSPDERRYVLKKAKSRLKPGGVFVLADEVLPQRFWARLWYRLKRAPIALWTYLLTQTSTTALEHPKHLLEEAGYTQVEEQRLGIGAFAIIQGIAAPTPEPQEQEEKS